MYVGDYFDWCPSFEQFTPKECKVIAKTEDCFGKQFSTKILQGESKKCNSNKRGKKDRHNALIHSKVICVKDCFNIAIICEGFNLFNPTIWTILLNSKTRGKMFQMTAIDLEPVAKSGARLDWAHPGLAWRFKGCGMGPWLVLASPCFRKNVAATCKIGSFLYSLDNLLQKNVIAFFFGNRVSKWRSFEKRAIFDLLFTFFSHQGKVAKIPSAHISLTYIHVFCSPHWLFVPYQFWKKNTDLSGISLVWVLVLILIRAILERSINNKMVSKI